MIGEPSQPLLQSHARGELAGELLPTEVALAVGQVHVRHDGVLATPPREVRTWACHMRGQGRRNGVCNVQRGQLAVGTHREVGCLDEARQPAQTVEHVVHIATALDLRGRGAH